VHSNAKLFLQIIIKRLNHVYGEMFDCVKCLHGFAKKKKNYLEVAGCFPVRLLRSSLMKKMKVSGPMTIIF